MTTTDDRCPTCGHPCDDDGCPRCLELEAMMFRVLMEEFGNPRPWQNLSYPAPIHYRSSESEIRWTEESKVRDG